MNAPPRWLQSDRSDGVQLVVIEPLFEEANRCRRLLAQIMHKLDAAGISTAIVALPGTGESLIDIADVRIEHWRAHIASLSAPLIASFRGGAILTDRPAWRFAPESGERLVRDLKRTMLTGNSGALYAGHRLSDAFLTELEATTLDDASRTVRLDSDREEADLKVSGPPLWRRAEPGEDGALAAALATDLIAWVKTCAAS